MPNNPPITDQDEWQKENLDYMAKDGVLASIVLPKLHAGDYELISPEDINDTFTARVNVTLDMSLLGEDN